MYRNFILVFLNLIIFETLGLGQIIHNGTYIKIDSVDNKKVSKTEIKIKDNIIEVWTKYYSKKVTNKNLFYTGTYKLTGKEYFAHLELIKCDTCPTRQWKRQLKHPKSFDVILSDQIDTTVINGDTAFSQPAISGYYYPVSVDRFRFLIIKVKDSSALIVNDRMFIRREEKDYR